MLESRGWREAMSRLSLGWVLYASGRHAEAAPLLDAGYEVAKDPARFTPGERVLRSVVIEQISELYRKAGDLQAAAKWQALGMAPSSD